MNDAIAGNDAQRRFWGTIDIVWLQPTGLFGGTSSANGREIRDPCHICCSHCSTLTRARPGV